MATWQDAVGNRPATASRPYQPTLGIVVTAAGALLAIGSLLTWITVTVKGKIGFGFFQFSPDISKSITGTSVPRGSAILASGIVVAGAGALMLLFRDSRGIRIGMGAVALAGVGVVVWVLLGLVGQKNQLQAAKDALQNLADSGGPLGFLVHSIERALKGAIHVKVSQGAGLYMAGIGFLAAAVGGIAAIVTGLLRSSAPAAAAAPAIGYVPPAGYGPQPAYPPPSWATPPQAPAPAPTPAPAAWPPGPSVPPGPPPAPPPMPGRGSHAPTVIEGGGTRSPTPPQPTVAEPPASDPNRLPPPRRRGDSPDQNR
jgi:hypothetical protein